MWEAVQEAPHLLNPNYHFSPNQVSQQISAIVVHVVSPPHQSRKHLNQPSSQCTVPSKCLLAFDLISLSSDHFCPSIPKVLQSFRRLCQVAIRVGSTRIVFLIQLADNEGFKIPKVSYVTKIVRSLGGKLKYCCSQIEILGTTYFRIKSWIVIPLFSPMF